MLYGVVLGAHFVEIACGQQPLGDAGARVLGYVDESQSVFVTDQHFGNRIYRQDR